MNKATLTRTRSGQPRQAPDPRAVAAEVEELRAQVRDISRVLAPAFAPPKEAGTVPERRQANGSSGMDWSKFPDHDPEFLSGKISLDQAKAKHPRPDEGCQCPNCTADRKQAAHRYVMPAPVFTPAKCAICLGRGYQGRPEAMGWTSCTACNAEEFFKLHAEAYQGNHYTAPTIALVTARERVEKCTECGGNGKVWVPVPAAPCSACRGTGLDNHVVMPPGVLWPKANGEFARDTSGDSPPQQSTMWSEVPEPQATPEAAGSSMPEPAAAPVGADTPPWAIARAMGARITQPRGY